MRTCYAESYRIRLASSCCCWAAALDGPASLAGLLSEVSRAQGDRRKLLDNDNDSDGDRRKLLDSDNDSDGDRRKLLDSDNERDGDRRKLLDSDNDSDGDRRKLLGSDNDGEVRDCLSNLLSTFLSSQLLTHGSAYVSNRLVAF